MKYINTKASNVTIFTDMLSELEQTLNVSDAFPAYGWEADLFNVSKLAVVRSMV